MNFKHTFQDKISRQNQDEELVRSKLKAKEHKLLQIEKDRHLLRK